MKIRPSGLLALFSGGLAGFGVYADATAAGPYLLAIAVLVVAFAGELLEREPEDPLQLSLGARISKLERDVVQLDHAVSLWEDDPPDEGVRT